MREGALISVNEKTQVKANGRRNEEVVAVVVVDVVVAAVDVVAAAYLHVGDSSWPGRGKICVA